MGNKVAKPAHYATPHSTLLRKNGAHYMRAFRAAAKVLLLARASVGGHEGICHPLDGYLWWPLLARSARTDAIEKQQREDFPCPGLPDALQHATRVLAIKCSHLILRSLIARAA